MRNFIKITLMSLIVSIMVTQSVFADDYRLSDVTGYTKEEKLLFDDIYKAMFSDEFGSTGKISVCYGFCKLFDAELQSLGIESYVIIGHYGDQPNLHCWNAFVLDGKIYNVDITYAITCKGEQSMWDFFVTDSTMRMKNNDYTIYSIW